ncbi:hypothetical protein WA026_009698 [Henosepilachna vigintioctopunctata]|uniref:Uncharacterized protein n=1 Tax=Henosepilachna vigintioctopunctata TaxID=420089 RepID=A0AAW1TZ32_9CUCU
MLITPSLGEGHVEENVEKDLQENHIEQNAEEQIILNEAGQSTQLDAKEILIEGKDIQSDDIEKNNQDATEDKNIVEVLQEENIEEKDEGHIEKEADEGKLPSSSSSSVLSRDYIDFDCSMMKCFKEIEISSSSIFKHPLYYFPEPEDPGILEAFIYEPPPPIENNVGRERYIRICKSLGIFPLRRVLESLESDQMDLRYYGLRPKELKAIFQTLEVNTYVNVLLLQDSSIDEESANLLSNMLLRNDTITHLDLKQCELGTKGAQALNEGIRSTVNLKELDLSFNSIGDKGIQALRTALRTNESIKKINLGHNNLSSAAANTLQQFFTHNEVIEDVNLEWNILCGDETIKKIATGLKANKNLLSLNLAWNAFGSLQAAKELGRYIRETTTLEYLDLSNNGFRGDPAMIIKRAIGANTSLKHVKLGNNPLSTVEAAEFGTMLLQSETLQTLDLENIYLDKTFNPTLNKIKRAGKNMLFGGLLRNYKIKDLMLVQ